MPAVIPAIIGAVGSIAGSAAKGRAQGRAAETALNTDRDQIAAGNFRTETDAALRAREQGLQERNFALQAPSTRLSQLLRGDILQNVQDPKINVPGLQRTEVTGGLRPSMFSDSARQGGGAMVQNALAGLLKGDQFDPMTLPKAPGLTPVPQSGGLDSFLNILGGVGSTVGAVAPFIKPKAKPMGQFDPSGSGGY